jgi:hypothetical protein
MSGDVRTVSMPCTDARGHHDWRCTRPGSHDPFVKPWHPKSWDKCGHCGIERTDVSWRCGSFCEFRNFSYEHEFYDYFEGRFLTGIRLGGCDDCMESHRRCDARDVVTAKRLIHERQQLDHLQRKRDEQQAKEDQWRQLRLTRIETARQRARLREGATTLTELRRLLARPGALLWQQRESERETTSRT